MNGPGLATVASTSIQFKHAADFRIAVAGSFLLHAVALGLLPPIASHFRRNLPDSVLEVQLVPAQPLPLAPTEIAPPVPEPPPRTHPAHPRVTPADTAIALVKPAIISAPNVPSEP